MPPVSVDLTRVRVCVERCDTCIFGPRSPNCHHGTVTGDRALMCRGFYDWCKATGWEPLAIQLGERLGRLDFVPVPPWSEGPSGARPAPPPG